MTKRYHENLLVKNFPNIAKWVEHPPRSGRIASYLPFSITCRQETVVASNLIPNELRSCIVPRKAGDERRLAVVSWVADQLFDVRE